MKPALILAAVLLTCSPTSAQLSGEACTWGAEVHDDGRSTVISARKAVTGWTVQMECSVPQRATARSC